MKVFLIIVAIIVISIIVAVIVKNAAKNYIHIESAVMCSRLFIDPDIEEKTIDLNKGGYIMVREGLDMIKISEATLKRPDVKIFETYDPNEPDKRKLAVAKMTDKHKYSGAILHAGSGIVYYEGDQAYIAKVVSQEVHLKSESEGDGKRHPGFKATDGDVSISFGEYWGWVEKLYGDYRIESGS